MKSAPLSLESIRLQLIRNNGFVETSEKGILSSRDAGKYLIKALEYADAEFSAEIENVLSKLDKVVIPDLLKGLKSQNGNVKSVCAMALIRIGMPAAEAIKQFYLQNAHRPNIQWMVDFILGELGESLPELPVAAIGVEPVLEKVG